MRTIFNNNQGILHFVQNDRVDWRNKISVKLQNAGTLQYKNLIPPIKAL